MSDVKLYSRDEIYRPFWEKESLLLEVSRGCSWKQCAFCYFAQDEFQMFNLGQIQEKAALLAPYSKGKERLFLLGENPFVMDTVKLLAVLDIVHGTLPEVRKISMYARADDVLQKTERDLALLRKSGVYRLYIGLESGSETVLRQMRKGETAEQIVSACQRLTASGIRFGFSIIAGLGGKALSMEHVRDTAQVINRTQPDRVWSLGLLLWEGTEVRAWYDRGAFHPLTARERLQETYELVKRLEMQSCIFADTTLLGKYSLIGKLPAQKQQMVESLEKLCLMADSGEESK